MHTAKRLLDLDGQPLDRVAKLAGVDLLVLVGLLLMGELRHGVDPITQAPRVAETVLPFLLAWAVLAVVGGAYGTRAFAGGLSTVRVTLVSWLAAVNLALIARGSPYLAGDSPWTFALVMSGLGAVALCIARPVVVGLLTE
ncbi:DUF3054 domain-containing protein [Haloarchaeobius sp. DFWS5]|uniref:DUF3054 domain-containing protein n=1 Tax=Haloarchaeobius sp. DFWS5 TaxID=3446114 RepID=UPI003EBCEC5B